MILFPERSFNFCDVVLIAINVAELKLANKILSYFFA